MVPQKKDWVQVDVVANGDYQKNELDGDDAKNIIYEIIIHCDQLEIIVPVGQKSFEVMGDDYGRCPLRWFEYDEVGFWSIKLDYPETQCPKCMDPQCLFFKDTDKKIEAAVKEIKGKKERKTNKQRRWMAYKAIARIGYGHLPTGTRRKLGICAEAFVRKHFPSKRKSSYAGFERGSAY